MTTLTATPNNTVTCWTCYKQVPRDKAESIKLLEATDTYRKGRQVWRVTGEVVYECERCQRDYFARLDGVQ